MIIVLKQIPQISEKSVLSYDEYIWETMKTDPKKVAYIAPLLYIALEIKGTE